ncbi:hypothetical protein GCM10010174_64880 [Kutzneria viridogrisea]|uniref:Tetratricopeptide (TPR) repeat protein n=1 Tax=Kutzneria viridogrisea TaxID=47990 RepID=A0ABR6BFE8_9PSEU|nr:tetratricopeptide (TPR) repeat protein [Kutzneria viridogrisea]
MSGVYERAQALIDLGRHEQAVQVLIEHLGGQPYDVQALNLLALAHLKSGNNHAALEAANSSAALTPDHEWPHRLRSVALAALGAGPDALAAAELAVSLAPHVSLTHANLATVLTTLGRPQDALAPANTAIGLAPNVADRHVQLARISLALKDLATARAAAQRAVQLEPDNAEAVRALAATDLSSGKLRSATELLLGAVRMDPRQLASGAALDVVGGRYARRLVLGLLLLLLCTTATLSVLALAPDFLPHLGDTLIAREVIGAAFVVLTAGLLVGCVLSTPAQLRHHLAALPARVPPGGWITVALALLDIAGLAVLPTQAARVPAVLTGFLLALFLLGLVARTQPKLGGAAALVVFLLAVWLVVRPYWPSQHTAAPPTITMPTFTVPSLPPGMGTGTAAGAWTEQFCKRLDPITDPTATLPPLPRYGTPPEDIAMLYRQFIAVLVSKRDKATTQFETVQPPPTADGPAMHAALMQALVADRSAVTALLREVDPIATADNPYPLLKSLDDKVRDTVKQGLTRIRAVLDSSPELREAAKTSLSCVFLK